MAEGKRRIPNREITQKNRKITYFIHKKGILDFSV